ncbi:MAG TPA: MmcQ/YjbR family DNA-binding protein [Candidatus Acidoferrales bacterium]|nr:MmcQ/YjbR family DNA-binding protein [Candidatus Acidoferrales bacterium]
MPATFSIARKIALALDGVEESPSYGTPGFKVRGALFARFHQDGKSLVVRAAIDKRDDMILTDPATYFITDHYLNYPWILVRLERIQPEALRDLLSAAHRSAAAEKPKRSTKRPARS